MRKQKPLAPIIFLCGILFSLFVLAFNDPDSFLGMKWGSDVSEFNDLKLVRKTGDEARYVRTGDKMDIGEGQIEDLYYIFYKDKFYMVFLRFKDLRNFLPIKEAFLPTTGDRL